MWTVQGSLRGKAYILSWADGAIVDAPRWLLDYLHLHTGQSVALTPTGPFLALDPTDGVTIYAALCDLTNVSDQTGDLPDVPSLPLGAVG